MMRDLKTRSLDSVPWACLQRKQGGRIEHPRNPVKLGLALEQLRLHREPPDRATSWKDKQLSYYG